MAILLHRIERAAAVALAAARRPTTRPPPRELVALLGEPRVPPARGREGADVDVGLRGARREQDEPPAPAAPGRPVSSPAPAGCSPRRGRP